MKPSVPPSERTHNPNKKHFPSTIVTPYRVHHMSGPSEHAFLILTDFQKEGGYYINLL